MSENVHCISADGQRNPASTSPYITRRKTVAATSSLSTVSGRPQTSSKRKRKGSSVSSRSVSSHHKHGYFVVRDTHGYQEHVYVMRDGTQLASNDCVYLVCEPPSEPYYLGRIMEFSKINASSTKLDAVRINWFYRPRDIQRQNYDSRLVFATMHSDISPLSSVRGKCRIMHRSQVTDIEAFRAQPDCFFYDRLFDKFMRRHYEVIPVNAVTNVPERVREVLQRRWKYVVVETNRSKELAMEHRACKRCNDWCSSKDSVRCAICKSDFHMQCVQPPLPRKPTRGFVWTCTPCSRAEALRVQEDEGHDSDMQSLTSDNREHMTSQQSQKISHEEDSFQTTRSTTPEAPSNGPTSTVPSEPSRTGPELWPYRYLGIHCNVNDAVDHDDRIYPRAASRIGQKYQATVQEWPGRPIEYFERTRRPIKRTAKAMKGKRSDERALLDAASLDSISHQTRNEINPEFRKVTIETHSDCDKEMKHLEASAMTVAERPLWLQERPLNYLARGEDQTSECVWSPAQELNESAYRQYFQQIKAIATGLGVSWHTPNFLDAALHALYDNEYNTAGALESLKELTRTSIKEPSFSTSEIARFENSVRKYGSELAQVAQNVATQSVADCVRFYYTWKKTPQGSKVWALSEARKPKIDQAATGTIPLSEDLGESSDDSAYDQEKAVKLKKQFQCKFCSRENSTRWRRAPGAATQIKRITALCDRCANLWRKYAVTWEPPEDIYRRLHESGYKNRKKRIEAELIKELPANGARPDKPREDTTEMVKNNKKARRIEKLKPAATSTSTSNENASCTICLSSDIKGLLICVRCDLHVHQSCYGTYASIDDQTHLSWLCDPCENDSSPHASTDYGCILCSVRASKDSICVGPVRKTAGNNWAHVLCATWIPGVSFEGSSTSLIIQGIASIPLQQWQMICAVCDISVGACVYCTACDSTVHVMCAQEAGYVLGFDVQPIKSSQSRRDSLALVRLGGEAGLMTPILYCRDHDLKRHNVHSLSQASADSQVTALALYNRTYKTVLKNLTRRGRTNVVLHDRQGSLETLQFKLKEIHELQSPLLIQEVSRSLSMGMTGHQCVRCQVEVSPCFYREAMSDTTVRTTNGSDGMRPVNEICHKCHWNGLSSKLSPMSELTTDRATKLTPAGTKAVLPNGYPDPSIA